MSRTTRPRYVPFPYQDSAVCGRLILRDGSTAHIRQAHPTDDDALSEFFQKLSAESRYRRFQSASPPGQSVIHALTADMDARSGLTLLVTRIREGRTRIVATGSYLTLSDGVAEVALAVADEVQGQGLGTLLFERLALLAAQNGIRRFWALTLAENRPMLELFATSGYEIRERASGQEIEVDLSLVPTETAVEKRGLRDRVATVASLRPFFQPNAIAVVGVSRDPCSVGRRIFEGLRSSGFRGSVYPVNPRAAEIAGQRSYPSIRDVPEPVDLAVLAVPAAAVAGVVDDCAARGVRAIVVVSAGFAEVGGAGIERQSVLVENVRGYGMRLIGPNCLGILNASPEVRLNASFSPIFPPTGRVAMSSQSGAIGLAVLALAERYGLGFSTFVSVGNKADVSGNDLLQYWEDDPDTDVILLYLESFGNPRRFARIARRVGQRKPVVLLHSGLTHSGGRAAGSHTAALASNATAVAALFRQTGVIRAGTLEEMFDLASMLGSQTLPRGNRVGVITNAGGPAILCTDACEAAGLAVPETSPTLRARLLELAPQAASLGNPVDLIASAASKEFHGAIEAMLTSGEVDALIVIFTPVGLAAVDDVTRGIADGVAAARAAGASDRPVLVCLLGQDSRLHLKSTQEQIPCYSFPESPARVLGKAVEYRAWRNRTPESFPDFDDIDLATAADVCRSALAVSGPGWLSAEESWAVLRAIGLQVAPGEVARTADDAVTASERMGFPVAVKLASRTLVHKTEVGGVRLRLADAQAVRHAFEDIRGRLERDGKLGAMEGVIVQPMLRDAAELMVGVIQDPLFGPLVAVGLGGIHVEVLADVAFRVAPLSDRDAAEMVRELRGFRLLTGYRGHALADIDALEEAVLRVSRLVEEVPQIVEIDLNPLFARPPGEGCIVADCRIRVHPHA